MDMTGAKSRSITRRRGSALAGVTEQLSVRTNCGGTLAEDVSTSSNGNTLYTREKEGKFRSNSAVEAGDIMQADEHKTAA